MNRPRHFLARLTAGGALAAGLAMGGYGIASAVTPATSHAASPTSSTSHIVTQATYSHTVASTKAPAAKTPATTKCPHMGSRPSNGANG